MPVVVKHCLYGLIFLFPFSLFFQTHLPEKFEVAKNLESEITLKSSIVPISSLAPEKVKFSPNQPLTPVSSSAVPVYTPLPSAQISASVSPIPGVTTPVPSPSLSAIPRLTLNIKS